MSFFSQFDSLITDHELMKGNVCIRLCVYINIEYLMVGSNRGCDG